MSGLENGLFVTESILFAIGAVVLIVLLPAAVCRQLGLVKWRWAKWKSLLIPGVCLAAGAVLSLLTPSLTHWYEVRSARSAIPELLLRGDGLSATGISISPPGPVKGLAFGEWDEGSEKEPYCSVELTKRDIGQEIQFISARLGLMHDLAVSMCTAHPEHATSILKAYADCGQTLVHAATDGTLGVGVGIGAPEPYEGEGAFDRGRDPGCYYVHIEKESEVNWQALGKHVNRTVEALVSDCRKVAKDL